MRILIGDDSDKLPDDLQGPLQQLFGDVKERSAARLAVSILSRLRGPGEKRIPGLDLEDQPELSSALLDALGLALLHQGYPEDAERLIGRALQIRREFYGEDHPTTAGSQISYSQLLRAHGQLLEAERAVRRALSTQSRIFGGQSLPVAIALSELAAVQIQQSDYTAAEQSALSGLTILKALGLECRDPHATRLMDILGRVQQTRGNYQRASEIYRDILELDRDQVGEKNIKYAMHLANLAAVEGSQRLFDAAERHYRQAIDIYRADTHNSRHPDLIDVLGNLGALLQDKGDLQGARRTVEEAIRLGTEVRGADHAYVAMDYTNLGRIDHAGKDFIAAEKNFTKALDLLRRNVQAGKLPRDHAHIAEALIWKGRALVEGFGVTRAGEAETLLRESIGILKQEFGELSVEQALGSAFLGRALFLQKKDLDEARERLLRSYPIVVAMRGADSAVATLIKLWIDELPKDKSTSD
jgi:tetratricopeptide (TPR) repeat protein